MQSEIDYHVLQKFLFGYSIEFFLYKYPRTSNSEDKYMMFQKEFYNFESLYKFIERT
jgi:hypothetical protein